MSKLSYSTSCLWSVQVIKQQSSLIMNVTERLVVDFLQTIRLP